MFLEAQFGADALTPIAVPRLPDAEEPTSGDPASNPTTGEPSALSTAKTEDASSTVATAVAEDGEDRSARERAELARLHKLGVPVPGVEIRVDRMVARVWLEDLDVECANRVFGDRVRAVVERAVEVVAPLWN